MPRILGIDPGQTTGYCLVECEAIGKAGAPVEVQQKGEVPIELFHIFLEGFSGMNLTHIVCEDWIQRPDYADGRWTKQDTAKQVGAVWHRASLLKLIYVEFQPSDKPNGYRAAGLKYVKGKKGTHKEDAQAHAFLLARAGFNKRQRKV